MCDDFAIHTNTKRLESLPIVNASAIPFYNIRLAYILGDISTLNYSIILLLVVVVVIVDITITILIIVWQVLEVEECGQGQGDARALID